MNISDIKWKDLTQLKKNPIQGSGRTVVYTAMWKDVPVIVKVQKKEAKMLELSFQKLSLRLPYMVEVLGCNKDNEGNNFIVLERLHDLPTTITIDMIQEIANRTLVLIRCLYKLGFYWTVRKEHIMLDSKEEIKCIDFNDDNYKSIPFFGDQEAVVMCNVNGNIDINIAKNCPNYVKLKPYSTWALTIYEFCMRFNCIKQFEQIVQLAIYNMLSYEYQHITNVHQAIYFQPFDNILRTETEKNDPQYGKLVKPNRQCLDRSTIMSNAIGQRTDLKSYLDIGSNVGWFPFYFFDKHKIESTGIDANKDAIIFSNMISELRTNNAVHFATVDITPDYFKTCKHYDIVSALSILHWLITLPPKGSAQIAKQNDIQYLTNIISGIGDITNHILFIELPNWILPQLGMQTLDDLCNYIKRAGRFKVYKILAKSDANRNILMFEK